MSPDSPSSASFDRRTFLEWAGVAAAAAIPARLSAGPVRGTGPAGLILRGGVVYDGLGGPPVAADVAVTGERITDVGRVLPAGGAEDVDLAGLALAPGFIDIHSHSDLEFFVDPRAESKVRQGVTTEVAGQDGGSMGPWSSEHAAQLSRDYESRHGVALGFRDLAGFFRRLDQRPAAVNVASMIGHGTIRAYVMGNADRPASLEELEQMGALVRAALQAGACGLSSGLEYIPGAFADLVELVHLAKQLRGTGLPYASHMRNEDDRLLAAVEEALNVGRQAGVPVQISHLKAQGERNWWKAEVILQLLRAARTDGLDVTFDRYPYVAYSTGLASLFPVWARDGGTEAFLGRLGDPVSGDRIESAVRGKIAQLGSWDAVQITSTGTTILNWTHGRRLGKLAEDRGEDPYGLLVRIIVEDRNRTGMVGFGMSEENTGLLLTDPLGMICSDGTALATAGPLSSGSPHPRSFGTFPRVLGLYSRDRRLMPLERAIHKMTGQPAARLRLVSRGVIAPNAFADLVAFDPATVADQATFERPHQYPVGIHHVLVNGMFVVRDGEHTGARPGQVLRGTAWTGG